MLCTPEKTPGAIPQDDKERLPLGPVTSWEVARVVVLLHALKIKTPLSPTDIRKYLTTQLGWTPSNHSLYNGILKPLRLDSGLHWTVTTKAARASEAHPVTRYTVGSEAEQILRIRLPRITERLKVTRRFLQVVLPLLPTEPDTPSGGIVTNTATLMRWLCLHFLTDGPKTQAALLTCLRTLSEAEWPSKSMCYRAINELVAIGAVTFVGERPAQIHLTPTGREVYRNLGSRLHEPVREALHFAEAAAKELRRA